MLILSRRPGESIQIGNEITITVTEVSGDKVKLHIDAPRMVPIVRSELLEACAVNREASASICAQSLSQIAELLHSP